MKSFPLRPIVRRIVSGLLITAVSSPAAAQMRSQFDARPVAPRDLVQVRLGDTSGEPGAIVFVPVTLATNSVRIGTLKLEIAVKSADIQVQKFESNSSLELADIEWTQETLSSVDGSGRGESIVRVQATAPTTGPGSTGIPSGLLGKLMLRIDESAKPVYVTVGLSRPEVIEVGAKTRLPFDRVRGSGAEAYISAVGGIPGCFFFTH